MKVAVIGAGPAGLYFSALLRAARPEVEIALFEQNPRGATFGFGVVFSDRALDFLRDGDPPTYQRLKPEMEVWHDLQICLQSGEPIRIDGVGFSAIGRLELLTILEARAAALGIACRYETAVGALEDLAEFDLVVGADGVNSLVRERLGSRLGARVEHGTNWFAWYGVKRAFDTLSQTFYRTGDGQFTAHHYRYSPTMSTFLVEVDRETWVRSGLERATDDEARVLCERVFAAQLDGQPLVSNGTRWRRFPEVSCERWSSRRTVLIGDAAHTAHFSIGSGTRLALEDALALVRALREHPRAVPDGLAAYEVARRPIVEKLVTAGRASMAWYERMSETTAATPYEFAYSYINRSGRVSDEALTRGSPEFMAALARQRKGEST